MFSRTTHSTWHCRRVNRAIGHQKCLFTLVHFTAAVVVKYLKINIHHWRRKTEMFQMCVRLLGRTFTVQFWATSILVDSSAEWPTNAEASHETRVDLIILLTFWLPSGQIIQRKSCVKIHVSSVTCVRQNQSCHMSACHHVCGGWGLCVLYI